jgi:hypothetical protein
VILIPVALVTLLVILINLPFGHKILTSQANRFFEGRGWPLTIEHISLSLSGSVEVSGIRMLTTTGDTILSVGDIQVELSIWPLFSRTVIISEVSLENAYANLVTDSLGRMNLVAIFADPPSQAKDSGNSVTPWEVQVENVHLRNIRFQLNDSIGGLSLRQSLGSADLAFDAFSLTEKHIAIGTVELSKASGSVSIMPSLPDTAEALTPPWKFSARNIQLANADYTYEDRKSGQIVFASLNRLSTSVETLDLSAMKLHVNELQLDEPHLEFTPAIADASTTNSVDTPVTFSVTMPWSIVCQSLRIQNGSFNIDTTGMSGSTAMAAWFPVKGLNTGISNIRLGPTGAACDMSSLGFSAGNQLVLQTGNIIIDTDSITRGNVTIELAATTLDGNTLSLPAHESIHISAMISGSPSELHIKHFEVASGSGWNAGVSGFVSDPVLFPESRLLIAFHTGAISRQQIVGLLPDGGASLPSFNPVTVSGKIENTVLAPTINLEVRSTSGIVKLDGVYDTRSQDCSLKAAFSDVRTAELFGDQLPETISGQVTWDGVLGKPEALNGKGNVHIAHVRYKEMTSSDFQADFTVANRFCRFDMSAADSTLTCDLKGEFGFVPGNYRGKLDGTFRFHEGSSGLLPGDMTIGSTVNASFSSSGGFMDGVLSLYKTEVVKDGQSVALDSMVSRMTATDNTFAVGIDGDFIHGEFSCRAGIAEFVRIIRETGFDEMFRADANQFMNGSELSEWPEFNEAFTVQKHALFNLFVPDSVFNFKHANLSASKAEGGQQMSLEFSVDHARYQEVEFNGTRLTMTADTSTLHGNLLVDSWQLKGKHTGNAELKLDILPERINSFVFIADTTGYPIYRIGAEMVKEQGQIHLRSSDSAWVLNRFPWTLSTPEFMSWNIAAGDFMAGVELYHEHMKISLNGSSSDSLLLTLDDVLISKLITPGILDITPDGTVNALVSYKNKNLTEIGFDVEIDQFKLDSTLAGRILASGRINADSTGLTTGAIDATLNDTSSVSMRISQGNTLGAGTTDIRINKLPVGLLEPFMESYVSDLTGSVSGRISISEDSALPGMDGEIRMNSVGLNIVPLQAWFVVPDDSIRISENRIYFHDFAVLDSLNKRLMVNGTLSMEDPEQVLSDLRVVMQDLRVMNTTQKDNEAFFGSVILSSGLRITGPVVNPTIKGTIVLEQGTDITYRQTEDVAVQETQKVVTFASLSMDTLKQEQLLNRVKELTGLPMIQTTIEINPKTVFRFEVMGLYDIHIAISGSGMLNYAMLPNNSMSLSGTYEIGEGTADLKFTGWPLKNFLITKGSSLRWDGEVTDPDLNLEATSKVKGSYVNPVDNKTRYVDFIVSMKLLDQVSKLRIVFDVKSTDQYITSVLSTLSEDEVMRQAINLLIFESINLPNIESSSNYLTSQINSFWESQLNALTKTNLNYVDLSFGLDTYTQKSAGGAEEEKTSLTYQVEKKFMKDRISVKLSGRFNEDPQPGQSSNTMIENFIIEYALDSLERRFLKLYTKKDYEDILDGEVTKSGVGFIYRKSYPDFRSIWHRKRKPGKLTGQLTPVKD